MSADLPTEAELQAIRDRAAVYDAILMTSNGRKREHDAEVASLRAEVERLTDRHENLQALKLGEQLDAARKETAAIRAEAASLRATIASLVDAAEGYSGAAARYGADSHEAANADADMRAALSAASDPAAAGRRGITEAVEAALKVERAKDERRGEDKKLTGAGYQQLIDGNLAWLATLPRTLERDHVISIVLASPGHEYAAAPTLSALAEAEVRGAAKGIEAAAVRLDARATSETITADRARAAYREQAMHHHRTAILTCDVVAMALTDEAARIRSLDPSQVCRAARGGR